ncbi:MAG: YciI family protein [Pseudomonadota bacterium]
MPWFDAAFKPVGSLMILSVPDRAGLDAYLAEEPFATQGVWDRIEVLPYRIASLPYRPLPSGPAPAARTHTITIAYDAQDAEAPARRAAARPPHFERVTGWARAGTLVLGGAILDESENAMIGSIAITAHASDAEAEAAWAEDPYVTGGVWRDVQRWGTRFAPLPYRPLPGAEA